MVQLEKKIQLLSGWSARQFRGQSPIGERKKLSQDIKGWVQGQRRLLQSLEVRGDDVRVMAAGIHGRTGMGLLRL